MKKMAILFFFLSACYMNSINAQDNNTIDIEEFKKEMEQQMKSFQLDISSALEEMKSAMEGMEYQENGDIIINGDTIIVAPGGALPEGMENFGEFFQQFPDANSDGFKFFFEDDTNEGMIGELFQQLEKMQGGIDDIFDFRGFDMDKEDLENFKKPNKPKKKEEPKVKPSKNENKRKTYSL